MSARVTVFACAVLTSIANAQTPASTAWVSPPASGTANGDSGSWQVCFTSGSPPHQTCYEQPRPNAVTPGGRFVVFTSSASNLVAPPPAYSDRQIYLRDLALGTTELISQSSAGVAANQLCLTSAQCVSSDGRFVAYTSSASNLDGGGAANFVDVFVRDRASGSTTCVSVNFGGGEAFGNSWPDLAMSDDGRYIAFVSSATDLVPNDFNGLNDVYLWERATNSISLISVGPLGAQADAHCYSVSISADGRRVAFATLASTLVAGDLGMDSDVFVRDVASMTTTRVSLTPLGAEANGESDWPKISGDGRWIVFRSFASNIVSTNPTGSNTFERDLTTGATTAIAAGLPNRISADGRFVVFESDATTLVPGDTNNRTDVFVLDTHTQSTVRASLGLGGQQANENSFGSSISSDGRFVTFATRATTLGAGALWYCDLFLRDLGFSGQPQSYCIAQPNSLGCIPTTGWSGTASASLPTGFTVQATNVLNQKQGLLFYGVQGAVLAPFSGGWMCIAAPRFRTPLQGSDGTPSGVNDCTGTIAVDFNALLASGVNPLLQVGVEVCCQAWSRDPMSSSTTSLSDALRFQYGP